MTEQLFFKKLKLLLRLWRISKEKKNEVLTKGNIIKLLRMNRNQLFKSELAKYLETLLSKYAKELKYKRIRLYIFEKEISMDDVLSEIKELLSEYYELGHSHT